MSFFGKIWGGVKNAVSSLFAPVSRPKEPEPEDYPHEDYEDNGESYGLHVAGWRPGMQDGEERTILFIEMDDVEPLTYQELRDRISSALLETDWYNYDKVWAYVDGPWGEVGSSWSNPDEIDVYELADVATSAQERYDRLEGSR